MPAYRVMIAYHPGPPEAWTTYRPPQYFVAEYAAPDEHVAELLGRANFEALHGIRTADGCAEVDLVGEPDSLELVLKEELPVFVITLPTPQPEPAGLPS